MIHCGKPFDQADVEAICSVGETTKELTDIGRFGIGFKSVYAFTDRPQIHSGQEDFAIEDYIRPYAISPSDREVEETVILIPRKPSDEGFGFEIEAGLNRLGPSTLLFLREIEEIEWSVDGGPSGLYLRSQPERLGDGVRRITVIGQAEGHPDVEESWLVFSKPVCTPEGNQAGYVEIAFSLAKDDKSGQQRLHPVSRSRLVVFFPTVVDTYLGFLVQGPYRTTPSRDNVPPHDAWNRYCVNETATVLLEALHWLRDKDLLDVGVLRCLPLDRSKFGERTMFAPIFEATKEALANEPLLPRYGGGHVAARQATMARTQELRELFSPAQLAALLGADGELGWLSGDISPDRSPDLRDYLIDELDIEEVRPETILPKLNRMFLEAQPEEWVRRLYEFLGGQKALLWRAKELPLIRLTDGKHVRAHANGQPQAFLPGAIETGFPTVHTAVCNTEESRAFLRTLGLTEPDPVDDVVRHVLPKYCVDGTNVGEEEYHVDIRRILAAFKTDSDSQRKKLVAALRQTPFVAAVEAGDGSRRMSRPGETYLATERLTELFSGVRGVLLVDNSRLSLRGDEVRKLLEASGGNPCLRPIPVTPNFTGKELRDMRIAVGCESMSSWEPLEDSTLYGLDEVLRHLVTLDPQNRKTRAEQLWVALGDLEDRRGTGVFSGTYQWTYYHRRTATFDAAFVRLLNEREWVPDANGNLQRPALVFFDSLGWKLSPLLLSRIRFKPPIIEQLAREAGIEPGALELFKRHSLTEAKLRQLLGENDEPTSREDEDEGDVDTALKKPLGDATKPIPAVHGPTENDRGPSGDSGGATAGDVGARTGGGGAGETSVPGSAEREARQRGLEKGSGKHTPGSAGGRPFISYVAVHSDEEEPDPDGLDQAARMALEGRAVDLIVAREPNWHQTPACNPGYDLFETGPNAQPNRWCEVKAMTGSLDDRPVGLSRKQFDCAREHGEAYWLYVVEYAADERARIVRIQDPAGKARTFTFDQGWINVAQLDETGN